MNNRVLCQEAQSGVPWNSNVMLMTQYSHVPVDNKLHGGLEVLSVLTLHETNIKWAVKVIALDKVKQAKETSFKTVAIEERDWTQTLLQQRAGEILRAGVREIMSPVSANQSYAEEKWTLSYLHSRREFQRSQRKNFLKCSTPSEERGL